MNEANEAHRAASALAAFQLTQLAFAALVKKGILPKAKAEEILREAIESIKAGGPGEGIELLKCSPSFWKGFPSFSRHLGNRATEEDRDNVLVISNPWTR